MKYYSIFLVFALLFLSKSSMAMSFALFHPACEDDAYIYAVTDSYYDNPDDSWDHYISSGQLLTEKNRNNRKDFLYLASKETIFNRNLAQKDCLQLNKDRVSFFLLDDAAVGCAPPTTSYTINKTAFDTSEYNKQVPNKLSLLNVVIRARFSSFDVLGDVSPEEFREYDVAANFKLPWAWYTQSGWGAGIRLMASVGALHGAGETALVASVIPLVALGSQDGKFTLDMGAGGALLSRHSFGTQDFGGHFQFALTAGVCVPLFKRLGAGYRYMHYSDAAIYGPHTTGADFHMLELIYRF